MPPSSERPKVKAGDVVRLTSGGPRMTAERVLDHVERPFAHCAWMDAREQLHRAFVNLDALELATDEPPRPDCPQARMAGVNSSSSSGSSVGPRR